MSDPRDATAFTDFREEQKRKKALGQRGKAAERAVKDVLGIYVALRGPRFTWDRPVDSREAGGAVKAVTGDYNLIFAGRLVTLEVKETEVAGKLPRKNLDGGQLGRLMRRALAGVPVWVIVHHKGTNVWKVQRVEWLFERREGAWSTDSWVGFGTAKAALDWITRDLFQ